MRLVRVAAGAVLGAACFLTACRITGPARPAGVGAASQPASAGPRGFDQLAREPLYTFTETELDGYLGVVRGDEPDLPRRVIRLARQNIGQPYEIFLLGEFPYELYDPDPLYCLARSDCLTFCEHTYAMALGRDWWSFLRILQRLRYRDGVIGMLTRNHYTESDWNRNNAVLLEDLTARLGGGQACVPMSATIRRAAFFAKFGIGQDIPDEAFRDVYIPKERVPEVLGELRDGDFVNIVRGDANAQYVGHTGLIALAPDGGVNLLHSARPAVREQPLIEYLESDRRCVGLRILRLRPDAQEIMDRALAAPGPATEISLEALQAALARLPLMPTGAPQWYKQDWTRAMHLQSYRLDHDTPVDPALQAAVAALDERIGGELGIPAADRAFGVLDLTDLRLALVRPDEMFYGASVPKLCIVLAYFEENPTAAAQLDPQARRELELVLKRSDNDLAAKYSQLVGLETIQKLLESDKYRFYDRERGGGFWCGKHYGLDQPRTGDPLKDHSHAATVRQCLRWYLLLEQGKLASAVASATIKQLMAAPELEIHNDKFVRGLAGRDVSILRKNGLWEDWHLDTARVQHGERLYLLAGMTRHALGPDYLARMAAGVDEHLCGPPKLRPYEHRLVMHANADDFRPGQFFHARPADAGPAGAARGVVMTCIPGEIAVYQSPVLDPGLRFNEVVLSWNITAPAGSGFAVEMRVGRSWRASAAPADPATAAIDADATTTDDTAIAWSPWLHVADGGARGPEGERLTKCDQGWIDVDYFRARERFDRVQYRVRAIATGDLPARAHVARMAVCASDLTGLPSSICPPAVGEPGTPPGAPLGAPGSPAADRILSGACRRLPVPFRSQATPDKDLSGKICSPTSVAMVLAYRDRPVPTEQVCAACYDRAHEIYGNWPLNVQAAYGFGVPGYLDRFSDWRAVEEHIAADQPLVISIRAPRAGMLHGAPYRATDGHLLVLVGFDANGDVEVNDPAARTPEAGGLKYRRAELEEVWMRATGGLAYVLLPPDSLP
ncbi:MAG: N-acetylmuramoyl-L-alanine amidase-like domain-containing protein [Planctomycetota bacterium]